MLLSVPYSILAVNWAPSPLSCCCWPVRLAAAVFRSHHHRCHNPATLRPRHPATSTLLAGAAENALRPPLLLLRDWPSPLCPSPPSLDVDPTPGTCLAAVHHQQLALMIIVMLKQGLLPFVPLEPPSSPPTPTLNHTHGVRFTESSALLLPQV